MGQGRWRGWSILGATSTSHGVMEITYIYLSSAMATENHILSSLRMPLVRHGLHILVICTICLAHQSLGSRLDDQKGIFGVPSMLLSSSYGQATLPSENVEYQHYFSVHYEKRKGGYYGVVATIDIWGHHIGRNQMTAAAIWITNGDSDQRNAIMFGWLVSPSRFNDSNTYLFTAWTRDNFRNTGCFNFDCQGIKLVSGSPIFPGDIISPVSGMNGVRQNITIKVFKDKSSGDWWLHCGVNSDPIPIGYFPASLFDKLSDKATEVWLGGTASNAKGLAPPPMGSGAFRF
uniref:Neprosin PEP catalytic domain-containing protein n=1 Tax=Hordeum vulgare subsp. vulgare TaxID=112509 RepID=A0A8I6Y2N2_HORVV